VRASTVSVSALEAVVDQLGKGICHHIKLQRFEIPGQAF